MEFKACRTSYAVFGVALATPLVLICAALIRGADPSLWQAFALLCIALASTVLGLSRYRLVITTDAVAYSSPLHLRRLIRRSDIVHADFVDETGPFESPITFVIRGRAGEEMRNNTKILSSDANR